MSYSRGFHTTIMCCGRPYKRRNSMPIIHASEKPAAKAILDFGALGTLASSRQVCIDLYVMVYVSRS